MRTERLVMLFLLPTVLLLALPAAAQQPAPLPRTFAIPPAVEIELTTDWVQLRDQPPPPPSQLVVAAPRVNFADVVVMENSGTHSLVKLLVSDNPFLGLDPGSLDARMRATGGGLPSYLFYFFFPPPRTCLVLAKSAMEAAKTKDDEHPRIERRCQFSPSAAELFASQISPGVIFKGNEGKPLLRRFYIAPVESAELNGKSFFLFEALADIAIDRSEVDLFNLPDDLQGARAHFFWAVGTDSPFPFVADQSRKNVRLIHLVYATLSRNGEGRTEFRQMLSKLRF